MQRLIAMLLALMLTACSLTPVAEDYTKWHPRMPTPYKACVAKPLVIISEGIPYVGYTYADSLEKAKCEERLLNYILQLHDVLCYYKEDCKKENNEQ